MGAPPLRSPGPMAALAGLALAGTAALPIVAGEASPLQLIAHAFAEHWTQGVVLLLVLGAPYLLGLTVAAAAVLRSTLGLVLVRVPVTILYAELVALALMIAHEPGDDLRAPWSLVGFAVVTTISGIVRVSGERRVAAGPNVAWLARWGATMVAGVLGWVVLQDAMPPARAPGLWGTLIAAAVLAASSRARPLRRP